MLPKDGFPGPCKIDDIEGIRIIALDTQWWLHRNEKPLSRCNNGDVITTGAGSPGEDILDNEQIRGEIIEEVNELLKTDDRETIIVSHHPVKTHGPHGGFFELREYVFPGTALNKFLLIPFLPIYPPLRWYIVKDDQDTVGPEYEGLICDMKKMSLGVKRPLKFAAGHDHNLQVLNGEDFANYVLVSGAGSEEKVEESAVDYESDTYFSHLHEGFMQLDILKDNKMYLCVVEPDVMVKNNTAVISPDFIYTKQLK